MTCDTQTMKREREVTDSKELQQNKLSLVVNPPLHTT